MKEWADNTHLSRRWKIIEATYVDVFEGYRYRKELTNHPNLECQYLMSERIDSCNLCLAAPCTCLCFKKLIMARVVDPKTSVKQGQEKISIK